MHGWPGGLSTQMPAFSLFFLSLAAHTPAAQNQAVQSWPGGGAGRRSDTHTLGGRGHGQQISGRGFGDPDAWLLREEGSQKKPVRLRDWSPAAPVPLSNPA